MNPRVSIIISNYNYGEYVTDAIVSAMKQTYPCHIVIVDDGSSDDSANIIRKCLGIDKIIRCEILNCKKPYYNGKMSVSYGENFTFIEIKNSGASTARNVGIWSVWDNTDVFGILDADDIYYETKVEILLSKLSEHKEVGVAYGDYFIHRPGYTKIEFKQPYSKTQLLKECIVHSGALIKKGFLKQVILENDEFYDSNLHGPLSQGFIGCTEDYDLWLRLSNACMICHVPKALSSVRETGKNQSMKMTPEIFNENIKIISKRLQ